MCSRERDEEHEHEHCEECGWCPTSECDHTCDNFFLDAYERGFGTS